MSGSKNKTLPINHTERRIYGLDVFRSFAILFVLVGHSFDHSRISPDVQVFGRFGILGVEIFFVLSGFLIGSIIMRLIDARKFHALSDVFDFWKRRWLRTLPLYLVILVAFLRLDFNGRHNFFDYPTYFFFMQNFASGIPRFFEISWSLAIEEHFYLWFPLVFIFFERITRRPHLAIICAAISFVVVSYTFRMSQPLFQDWNEYNFSVRMVVLSRLDSIMFGVLVAALKHYWVEGFEFLKRVTPVTAILFAIVCFWWFSGLPRLMDSRFLQLNLFTFQAALCALLLPWFDSLHKAGKSDDFFSVTSRLSYSLYMVHILIIVFVNRMLQQFGLYDQVYFNPLLLYMIYFSFFYFFSWVTYRLIEQPFLRLRDVNINFCSVSKASWVSVLTCLVLVLKF